jgi:predicted ATP-grasp superfamily ATP-dependent carboligase
MTLEGARILVTDAGWAPALAIIRSLARAGAEVIAAAPPATSAGFFSRHTAARLRYPSAELDPHGAVEAILTGARRFRADLVVPLTDRLAVGLSDAAHRFDGVCPVTLPHPSALEVSRDKAATLVVARSLGLRVPRTLLVRTVDEARQAAAAMTWPLVLKPQYSHHSVDEGPLRTFAVLFADSPEELARKMASYEGRCPVLLQEFVPGWGEGVELLLHDGRPLAAFQHRRLREVPPTGGTSSLRESVPLDPSLYEQAAGLLGQLRWTGLAMVEFRVHDGNAVLMEVNGRVWGSLPLAVHSGMDFPMRLAELYLSGPPPDGAPLATTYRHGVRVRNLEMELRWIASVALQRFPHRFHDLPHRSQALSVALELLGPANKFDVQSLNDPLPGLVDAIQQVGGLGRRLASRRHHSG